MGGVLSALRGSKARRRRTLPQPAFVNCGYCRQVWGPWPGTSAIEACPMCRRPLVLARTLNPRRAESETWSVIDLIEAAGGMALIAVFPFILFGPIPPFAGGKILAIAVFVEGSVFLTDGVLGMSGGVSRVGKHLELGERARLIGFARALFGAIAYGISAFGVALFTRLI